MVGEALERRWGVSLLGGRRDGTSLRHRTDAVGCDRRSDWLQEQRRRNMAVEGGPLP